MKPIFGRDESIASSSTTWSGETDTIAPSLWPSSFLSHSLRPRTVSKVVCRFGEWNSSLISVEHPLSAWWEGTSSQSAFGASGS